MSAAAGSGSVTQVLEFRLGDGHYCVDIGSVAEIVDLVEVTSLPNTPRGVRGVMDLRGRTTKIVDPTVRLGLEARTDGNRVIVFDSGAAGGESVGWVVDDVTHVREVDESDVDTTTVTDDETTRGIVRRDGGFVVWVAPRESS